MGKASRRKDEPDHLARVKAGRCLRCGKRPPLPDGIVWCRPCTDYGHAVRRSRREHMPTPTRAQWQALYDVLDPDHKDHTWT